MQLLGTCESGPGEVGGVESRALVGVLAVAQHGLALPCLTQPRREALAVGVGRHDVAHPGRDRDVVGRGVREGFGREALALRQCEATLAQSRDHVCVALGRDDDGDVGMVFGRCAHHGRTADVDLLDALVWRRPRRDGAGEWIEVDDDELERRDAQLVELVAMVGQPQIG